MLDYVALYPNEHAKDFNETFLDGTCDVPMEECVISAMKEFEAIENIKIEYVKNIIDQDEIDFNYHVTNINFKKKNIDKIEIPKKKYIMRSRYGELTFGIRITTNLNERFIEKKILYPIRLEDGSYLNNGKKMDLIWQVLEASTYGQRGKITLKSRMPVIIYRNRHRSVTDVHGTVFIMPSYSYALDTKPKKGGPTAGKKKSKYINPVMIYSTKMGFSMTREFFGMTDIVDFVPEYDEEDDDRFYFFPVNNIFVRVDQYFFDKYQEVQAFTCMCCNLANKDFPVTMDKLENREYWMCRIGFVGSIKGKNNDIISFREKGRTTIYMIERLVDQTTIKNLRVPGCYKHNVYYLIYWMIMNFDELKAKRNLDVASKRIRRNEVVVNASLGRKISENINKLVEKMGKSRMNTIDSLLELFNFNSNIILSSMRNMSDIVKADYITNDLSIVIDLSWTSKGPNSMGEGNNNKIMDKYRYLDPSFVGVYDISTSSNSDVGLSGAFVPYVKTYDNFYFTPNPEPAEGRYRFEVELSNDDREGWTYHCPYDLSTFASYVKSIEENDPFRQYLQYEKIQIIEKEETNGN